MTTNTSKPLKVKVLTCSFAALVGVAGATHVALGGPREQANTIFNRLNGIPPTAATLDAMAAKISAGDAKGAALMAIDDPAGMFYNLMLKDMISRWTNTDKSPRVDLNDYTATVIGMVRDDVPFDQVLSGDIVYVGDATKVQGLPAYSLANNDHYKTLDTQGANLKDVLVQQKQSGISGLPADATAGVITTRGFAEAYFKDGTNRRAAAFTFDTFLCNDMNKLADTTRSDMRVRRDVTRAPGGDSALYRNRCAGCHAGMDAMAGAFAYYDVIDGATPDQDQFVYTPGQVATKMNRNAGEFPDGYVTNDDSWINNWLQGQNASIGWHGAPTGNGAKSLGETIADSDAFNSCMVQRAMTEVCLHAPTTNGELDALKDLTDGFKQNHNLKDVFAQAAVVCTTEE